MGVKQVDVIEVQALVWPDGALGCPQPGMAYTQALQEGLFIRLRMGKRTYNYHSGGSASFLCEKSLKNFTPAPLPGAENQ